MKDDERIEKLVKSLVEEEISSWFDLGLFLDRIKEERFVANEKKFESFQEFINHYNTQSIAFLTFHYNVDGVTVEISKYAELIKRNLSTSKIHYIGGIFRPEAEKFIPSFITKHEIPELQGFDEWKLYTDFYFTSLQRGSPDYNNLISQFWQETLDITEKLGRYIIDNDIQLLFIVNVNSNPGNISFSMATVLLSEYLGIPVINNNHDFYWEGGSREGYFSENKKKKGPRDFFFTNSNLGEVFSILETLFPWDSPRWIHVNINSQQSEYLIKRKGINPANVMEIGTAVDTDQYRNIDKRKKINAFFQFEKILSRYRKKLIAYSVEDTIKNNLVDAENPMPILIGNRTKTLEKFIAENIIFLQPTRIISRKRIEAGFRLLVKILEKKSFRKKMETTRNLKLTLLVTGPIAAGQYEYFLKLLGRFQRLLQGMDEQIRDKIFVAFLFSELDRERFKKRFDSPVGIPELYNIASLVLLPSKTEGRGLPIIEAAACGTPIFVRKYSPRNVYEEVIGIKLQEQNRLKVIEYDGKNMGRKCVNAIINRVLFPHKYTEEFIHNRKAVIRRFSLRALNTNIRDILYRLNVQSQTGEEERKKIIKAFRDFRNTFDYKDENLRSILNIDRRQYLAGYGKMSFMIYLKSLIDPSFFRVEQMEFKGRLFSFALNILKKDPEHDFIPMSRKLSFFNCVEAIFNYRKGKLKIRHDHSLSYRHRNNYHYPYQDYTMQELTGLVNSLYFDNIEPTGITHVKESPHFFTDWNLALLQLTGSAYAGIDNRNILIKKLKENVPIACFPGEYLMHELELFILQPVRSRLKLGIEEVITDSLLEKEGEKLARVYIFTQEKNLGNQLNRDETAEYILHGKNDELRLLYEYNLLQIIPTEQWTVGIHFGQLGKEALEVLMKVKELNGFLITNRRNAILMTDIVDLDRFHIGKVRSILAANMLGIPVDSGYIQFVPAGLRTTLGYPVPVQTAKDFDRILKGKKFKQLKEKIGEKALFEVLRKDALEKGSPVKEVLSGLGGKNDNKLSNVHIRHEFINGVYDDGNPYNGVVTILNTGIDNWEFIVETEPVSPKPVTMFVKKQRKKLNTSIEIAWNGGYILNPELIGKLGLVEEYIGSPLGLIISGGRIVSPPLFNKAALLIDKHGRIDIRRINCQNGFKIKFKDLRLSFPGKGYNSKSEELDNCFYDLLYNDNTVPCKGRIILRLAGNIVKEVIDGDSVKEVKIIPAGLSLSIKKDIYSLNFKSGDELEFIFEEFKNIRHAVEAGPQLLDGGEDCIDMKTEGWKHINSIRTQAARLDYSDMRGPKIAAGIDKKGMLMILAVNGRIRESVGATHSEMANILKERGMIKAMGFDPGGSSTLFVQGEVRNISPYNHVYADNIYSLPPEPRAISSAIMGYLKK